MRTVLRYVGLLLALPGLLIVVAGALVVALGLLSLKPSDAIARRLGRVRA